MQLPLRKVKQFCFHILIRGTVFKLRAYGPNEVGLFSFAKRQSTSDAKYQETTKHSNAHAFIKRSEPYWLPALG